MNKQEFFDGLEAFFSKEDNSQSSDFQEDNKNQQNSTFNSSRDKKLFKNRISAQNSRLKKKKYIDDLEKNQRQLIKQIQQTEKEIQKTNQQLNAFLTKNKQNDSFNHDQKPTYERLKNLIRGQQHFDEDQANMLIQLLINRVGVTGKERRRKIDYYTKRLVNFSIPAIYRYLLHASTEENGLLAGTNKGMYTWDQQLYKKMILSQKQKHDMLKNRQKVAKQKQSWTEKINEFGLITQQIYKTSFNIQVNLLSTKSLLNIKQVGQIIIGIQNRKYNKNIALDQNEFDKGPIKKIKHQFDS